MMKTKYIPLEFEGPRPLFKGIGEWVVKSGEAFELLVIPPRPLSEGEIVIFKCINYIGRMSVTKTDASSWSCTNDNDLTMRPDGYALDGKPETASRSISEIAEYLRVGQKADVVCYRYTDSEPFVFNAGVFEPHVLVDESA